MTGDGKNVERCKYVLIDWYTRRITRRLMIGGRLLSIRDAIGRSANDCLSDAACLWTPLLLYSVHSRDTYSALHWRLQNWSTVRFVRSFVRYKTPLEPVFRAVDPENSRYSSPDSSPRCTGADFCRDETLRNALLWPIMRSRRRTPLISRKMKALNAILRFLKMKSDNIKFKIIFTPVQEV